MRFNIGLGLDFASRMVCWLLGGGWRSKAEREADEKREIAEWVEKMRFHQPPRMRVASVPPVVYHGDTPSKEPVVTMPQQDAFPPSMDQLPDPTSVIYLYVVENDGNGGFKVMRASSEDPVVPNLSEDGVEEADDFGTFETEERAVVVAKKLNDEERARRFA